MYALVAASRLSVQSRRLKQLVNVIALCRLKYTKAGVAKDSFFLVYRVRRAQAGEHPKIHHAWVGRLLFLTGTYAAVSLRSCESAAIRAAVSLQRTQHCLKK